MASSKKKPRTNLKICFWLACLALLVVSVAIGSLIVFHGSFAAPVPAISYNLCNSLASPSSTIQQIGVTPTFGPDTYPQDIAISGNYAYVANIGNNTISVVDVSKPTAPAQVATATVTGLGPIYIAVSGNYAYVANYGSVSISPSLSVLPQWGRCC